MKGILSLTRFHGYFWFAARLFLGFFFAYAGFSKLMEPLENFRGIVAQYEIIPSFLVPWIAHILPWMEFLFGVFLIVGWLTRPSALTLSLLSLGFIIILVGSKWFYGLDPADCGCFGENSLFHFSGRQILLLDTFNFLIGLRLFFLRDHFCSLGQWLKK